MERRISQFKDKSGQLWPRIETDSATLTGSFIEAAKALNDLILPGHEKIQGSIEVPVYCESSDLEFLLADWINTLVFEMNARSMIFTRFEVHVEGIHVKGKMYGEKWEKVKMQSTSPEKSLELQGVAFDHLSVHESKAGWATSLVLNDRARHPLRLGSIAAILMSSFLFLASSCTTVQEKNDRNAGLRHPVADYSKKKLIENFDLLTLFRVAIDGTNLCKFQGEDMTAIPQLIRGRLDSWARGLPLDEGLPTLKELNECASTCRCSSYVYWLDQKGAYPSDLSPGYRYAAEWASKMKNTQALACGKKLQSLCQSETLKDYR